jgi:aspartokinase
MKILKFGGTSVGSVENLQQVKNIVEKVENRLLL